MNTKLSVEDYKELWGDLSDPIKKRIAAFDSSVRYLDQKERDAIILNVLNKIDSPLTTLAGRESKDKWTKGWGENLKEFVDGGYDLKKLVPKYVRPNQVVRFKGDYAMPADPEFELHYYDIYRRWLFETYIKGEKTVYEFGCGSGYNVPVLCEMFPEKEVHGLDWVVPSKDIVDALAKKFGYNAHGHVFDMATPDTSFKLKPGSAVVAIGALEQMGTNFKPFVDYLLSQKPSIFIHVDSMLELYDPKNLSDFLAIKFDMKRKYLEEYIPYIHQLEKKGVIEIITEKHIPIGSLYHDGYSLAVWRPKV